MQGYVILLVLALIASILTLHLYESVTHKICTESGEDPTSDFIQTAQRYVNQKYGTMCRVVRDKVAALKYDKVENQKDQQQKPPPPLARVEIPTIDEKKNANAADESTLWVKFTNKIGANNNDRAVVEEKKVVADCGCQQKQTGFYIKFL